MVVLEPSPNRSDPIDITAFLRAARKACGMTVQELAVRSGFTVPQVKAWLYKSQSIRAREAEVLLSTMGYSLAMWLWDALRGRPPKPIEAYANPFLQSWCDAAQHLYVEVGDLLSEVPPQFATQVSMNAAERIREWTRRRDATRFPE